MPQDPGGAVGPRVLRLLHCPLGSSWAGAIQQSPCREAGGKGGKNMRIFPFLPPAKLTCAAAGPTEHAGMNPKGRFQR